MIEGVREWACGVSECDLTELHARPIKECGCKALVSTNRRQIERHASMRTDLDGGVRGVEQQRVLQGAGLQLCSIQFMYFREGL